LHNNDDAELDDVDGYKNLQELLQKLDRALHVAPPTKQAAAADAPGTGSKTGGGVHAGTVAEPLVRCGATCLDTTVLPSVVRAGRPC